jgi:hypothetical protein
MGITSFEALLSAQLTYFLLSFKGTVIPSSDNLIIASRVISNLSDHGSIQLQARILRALAHDNEKENVMNNFSKF